MSDNGTRYVGLMSGTSADAVDSAIVECDANGQVRLIATHEEPIEAGLRERIAAISQPGDNEVNRLGELDRELGHLFARAALNLVDASGCDPSQIRAIGCHGQTIRHYPPSSGRAKESSFTLQIGDANTIAEETGICTVADFRRRDIAAGGEGAPLAPAFHAAVFGAEGVARAIVNIGGIANVSLLDDEALIQGFDSGPGNTLMDNWCFRHRGESFDRDGRWAASGRCRRDLLQQLLAHPYFDKRGPRSTGKELFNLDWLDTALNTVDEASAVEVQATLLEFTAATISRSIQSLPVPVAEVYICGGGAHNGELMRRLEELLAPAPVNTTSKLGMDPDWVEAATFAWLAHQTLQGAAGNAPMVTGASGTRVLGAVYHA